MNIEKKNAKKNLSLGEINILLFGHANDQLREARI